MAVFKKQEESIEEGKDEYLSKIEAQFSAPPEPLGRTPLNMLFTGSSTTGKSSTALSYLRFMKKNEVMMYIDLDAGAMENISEYFQQEYDNGQIRHFNPIEKNKKGEGRRTASFNYDKTMENLRKLIAYAEENWKRHNIKVIVFDGLSVLREYSELQMKLDKNLDASGDPKRKYWRERNLDVLEPLKMLKMIPIDVIIIGGAEFCDFEKAKQALYQNINDLVSQKVIFRMEEDEDRNMTFYAKIAKSRQNVRSLGDEVQFATIDGDRSKDFLWDSSEIIKRLQSEKNPILG